MFECCLFWALVVMHVSLYRTCPGWWQMFFFLMSRTVIIHKFTQNFSFLSNIFNIHQLIDTHVHLKLFTAHLQTYWRRDLKISPLPVCFSVNTFLVLLKLYDFNNLEILLSSFVLMEVVFDFYSHLIETDRWSVQHVRQTADQFNM